MTDPDPRAAPRRALDLAIAAALACLTVAVYLPVLRWGVIPGDEGHLVYGAERILQGQVLYRDFERSYAPGVFYVFAGVFRLFGSDLLLAREVWLGCLAALAALTYWVARPLTPLWAAVWAGLVPVLLRAPSHKTFVPLTAIFGLALCQRLVRRPGFESAESRRAVFLAGLGIGVIGLFRQEAALYTLLIAAGTLSALGGPTLRRLATLGAGVAAVALPLAAAFAAAGALPEMIEQTVFGAASANADSALPFPSLGALFLSDKKLRVSAFFLPTASALVGVVAVALLRPRGDDRRRAERIVLAQWTAMAILQHSNIVFRSDFAHITQVLPVAGLIAAWAAGAAWRGVSRAGPRARRVAWAVAGMALLAWGPSILLWGSDRIAIAARRVRVAPTLEEPRAAVIAPPFRVNTTNRLLEALRERTRPGEPIFVAPYAPLLYFVAERPNPTRHDALAPGMLDQIQEEIIREIEASALRIVLVDNSAQDGREQRRVNRFAPIFARYMEQNFTATHLVGSWILFERRTGPRAPADPGA